MTNSYSIHHVVISGPYTKGSVRMAKRRFSSHLASDEITTRGYRVLTFVKCTTIIIAVLAVTSGLGSPFDWIIWFGMVGMLLV
jgi:hypothetical protein